MAERLEALNTRTARALRPCVYGALSTAEAARRGRASGLGPQETGWHPGVVGIVAARLKETTNRPAVVIGLDGGMAKVADALSAGSILAPRSKIGDAKGCSKGGGHKMAAGLTREPAQLRAAWRACRQL